MVAFDHSFCSDQLVRTESTCKEEKPLILDQPPEINLWERLGNAASLDIESSDFSWNMLSSLHHTEHSSSLEHFEDDTNKALEVSWVLFLSTNL
jgi:atypical dual specificity phosphatase